MTSGRVQCQVTYTGYVLERIEDLASHEGRFAAYTYRLTCIDYTTKWFTQTKR